VTADLTIRATSDAAGIVPVRIAYLVSRYPAISHTFILREVRQLRAMNFDIRVASINSPDRHADDMAGEERAELATTFYVKQAGARAALKAHIAVLADRPAAYFKGLLFAIRLGGTDLGQLVFAVFYFIEAVMIGRWMESNRLHHLHVHFATAASTVGLITSRIFPIGFSFTVHGPDEFYDVTRYRLAEKIAGASFVVCIGYFARSQLMKLSPASQWRKFEIAPLGVDPAIFSPHLISDPADGFEIISVGRLVPAKGQQILIAAVDRLVKAGRNLRLRIVGSGPDRKSLELEVARRALCNHVIFEGAVNQDHIRELYGEADAFVLASFAEGVPVVLMEAMAMEIACVATSIAGIPELIRNGVDGLLVAPSDERALAAAIDDLIKDPATRRRLGIAGRKRVIERYNLNDNVARLGCIFTNHLAIHAGEFRCAN
jgi:colanic acid/amylovoran biosynthesis glycosyltransferase